MHSDIFKDMLAARNLASDGTKLNSLVLTGDSAKGWGLLLGAFNSR